jgi:hypothetical protein
MGNICNKSPVDIRIRDNSPDNLRWEITKSNERSAKNPTRYICCENEAILNDYEFVECSCNSNCWCKKHSCKGHYRIKAIEFEQFLKTYMSLWTPLRPKKSDWKKLKFIGAVQNATPFNGRQKKAIKPLRWLQEKWRELLDLVRAINMCGLCEQSLPAIEEVIRLYEVEGDTNIYEAKMWSQLFYDCIVPFDTDSGKRLPKAGYHDPKKQFMTSNRELFCDLRAFSERECMTIEDIRSLDEPWIVISSLAKPVGGQPLSRVIDKMFYAP